jgi:site-specific recombinase XerD
MDFRIQAYESYLNSLADSTRSAAVRVMDKYLIDCDDMEINPENVSSVSRWVEYLHSTENDGLSTATIWSYLSHVNAYFEFGYKIIVKDEDRTIQRKLKQWMKNEEVKKAKVSYILLNFVVFTL